MLVAQYPEWIHFSDAANSTDIRPNDITEVVAALRAVVQTTEKKPEIASPEVPRTLRAILDIVSNPKEAGKKAALAAIRTLENLVIRVFNYGGDLIDETAKKTISTVSTTASRVLAVAILGLGLTVASNLMGVSASIDGMGWIKDAAAIVKSQLDLLKLP